MNFQRIAIMSTNPHPISYPQNLFLKSSNRVEVMAAEFNSHHTLPGYKQDKLDGQTQLNCVETMRMSKTYDNHRKPSVNTARWKADYNPDLILVSSTKADCCPTTVLKPITPCTFWLFQANHQLWVIWNQQTLQFQKSRLQKLLEKNGLEARRPSQAEEPRQVSNSQVSIQTSTKQWM